MLTDLFCSLPYHLMICPIYWLAVNTHYRAKAVTQTLWAEVWGSEQWICLPCFMSSGNLLDERGSKCIPSLPKPSSGAKTAPAQQAYSHAGWRDVALRKGWVAVTGDSYQNRRCWNGVRSHGRSTWWNFLECMGTAALGALNHWNNQWSKYETEYEMGEEEEIGWCAVGESK